LNDPLTRALLFVPLFTLLIVRLHRNTLAGSPGLTGVLNQPLFTYLVRLQDLLTAKGVLPVYRCHVVGHRIAFPSLGAFV
jgi:hypothetical protein